MPLLNLLNQLIVLVNLFMINITLNIFEFRSILSAYSTLNNSRAVFLAISPLVPCGNTSFGLYFFIFFLYFSFSYKENKELFLSMHEHIPAMNTIHLAKMLIQKSLNIWIRQILRREVASPFLYIFLVYLKFLQLIGIWLINQQNQLFIHYPLWKVVSKTNPQDIITQKNDALNTIFDYNKKSKVKSSYENNSFNQLINQLFRRSFWIKRYDKG